MPRRLFGLLTDRRAVGLAAGVAGVTAVVLTARPADADILARVGAVAAAKVRAGLPDAAAVAGPLAALRPGDVLPVEERVRVRVRTDKRMDGADVTVVPGGSPGEVKLRGVVPTAAHRQRAGELAEGTVGVGKVVNEIAVPE